MTEPMGKTRWAIAEGFLPEWSTGPEPEMKSHGTLCFLNTGDTAAQIDMTVYFGDREPVGPYRIEVAPRRTLHQRLGKLTDPEPIPTGEDFAVSVESSQPIVVQHTRLDSRQSENALMTTIAYGD